MAIYYQPPPPFTGGHQPDTGPLGPVITAAAITNPPFGLLTPEYPVYFAWLPDPPAVLYPIKLAQAAQIDFAPFGRRDWRQTARVDAWIIDPPIIQLQQKLPQVFIPDFASFGRRDWRQTARVEAWLPDPPLIFIPAKLAQAAQIDFAPFGRRDWRQTARVDAWLPDPPPIGYPAKLVQEAAAVAALQPFGQAWLTTVLRAWDPLSVTQPVLAKLIQSAQIDSPLGRPFDQSGLLQAWGAQPVWPPGVRSSLVQAAAVLVQPPFNRFGLIEILQAWVGVTPLPQKMYALVQAAASDNPPFGVPAPSLAVLPIWQAPSPTPILPRYLIPSSVPVDFPPPYTLAQMAGILAAWERTKDVPRQERQMLQQFSAVFNDPPFGLRTPLWPIIHAWQPGPPQPWRRDYLVQPGTAVQHVWRVEVIATDDHSSTVFVAVEKSAIVIGSAPNSVIIKGV